jgi:hypothetical protein
VVLEKQAEQEELGKQAELVVQVKLEQLAELVDKELVELVVQAKLEEQAELVLVVLVE